LLIWRLLLLLDEPTEMSPLTVRFPPEMPTALVVLIVREAMVWSPPRLVLVEFEDPVAEKTISEPAVKLPVVVPAKSVAQLLAAVQELPAEPRQKRAVEGREPMLKPDPVAA
jgi:hypothetical protein